MTNGGKIDFHDRPEGERFRMANNFALIIAMVSLIFAIFLFYWYEWRPSQIRKECAKWTLTLVEYYGTEKYNNVYNNCLNEKGLIR